MKIKANVNYQGIRVTSVSAKYKMRGSYNLDLPDIPIMDWAQKNSEVVKHIKKSMGEKGFVPSTLKIGSPSYGQYQIGSMVTVNGEVKATEEIALKIIEIEKDHLEKKSAREKIEVKINDLKKEIRELQKHEDYKFSEFKTYHVSDGGTEK